MKATKSAFAMPAVEFSDHSINGEELGLTIRDYIAIQAISGAVNEGAEPRDLARRAYAIADAMIEASLLTT